MSSKFWAELSNDYEKLFETGIGYDVIIHVGEGQNVKEIHAHSNILCARSQYFRTSFSNEWAEKRDGKFIFRKPNISPQLFIYCGNIELKNLQGPDVLKLLIAVDELSIHSLISHIQEFLIEHQTVFLHQNPTEVLETVYQNESFKCLWDFCLENICKEPKILFNFENYTSLKPSLLEILLERDDLNIDEIEIWENLLKWCFAQQNNIQDDPTKWNKEDITRVEKELYRFIPLIRFYNIELTDFFYKVYCYRDILPQDLIHDLLEYHIVPNMKHKDNLPPPRKPNQDGIDTSSFHRSCDNKGATIWVAKIKNSTQLIGGYNPLDWDGVLYWKTTTDSFLFNFLNGKDVSSAKIGYVNKQDYAVFCHDTYGPTMGNLYCEYNSWSNRIQYDGERYPNIGIPEYFTIEDYEVFQIIKNRFKHTKFFNRQLIIN
ncbi:hypothetical protein RclHR1_11570003 [Rhizophagus clarus]|uniref:BTB domain-containing protein n=1 Tax=Rhizophagus clarus TaxID=94130 RepID=A0A2Z6QJN0_9GLOM|nr:hypothetical protein RclHR1_11570003 [Rhizophagus clarus]GET01075.1 hypothetical protein GLOIN_2v1790733 [Rhizophagus clarus]